MGDLDRAVRPARWWEYFGLAGLVARRVADVPDARGRPGGRLRRSGLWLTALSSLVAYGAWTTEHRQAVASWWVLGDDDRRPLLRALPAILVLGVAEVAILAAGPRWVPPVVAVVLAALLGRMWPRWRSRSALRAQRRPGAVYVANLASGHKGAGRVLLDYIAEVAAVQGRFTCLESAAHPDLIAFYAGSGFTEVRRVDADGQGLVYMERPPTA